MRLLQLSPDGNDETALDLHPMVTVVRGLSANGRELVRRAVSALPAGLDPGMGGLVEAHGVLLALNPDTLAMLDLDTPRDVVVGAGDLPIDGHRSVTAGVPSVADVIERTPEGHSAELDRQRRKVADADEAVQVLREAVARARAELDEVTARRAELVERLGGAASDESGDDPRAALQAEREEALAVAERASRGLDELGSLDPRPVQVLLEAIRNPAPIEYVPSERGAELADEFVRLQAEVAVLEQRLEEEGVGTASAMARLEAAREQVAAAEKAMRKPELTEADRIELEAAHDAVLEAEKKATRGRNKKRLEEALAAEQAILDRIGFPSWSAYVMGAALMSIDPLAEQRLDRARAELAAAEEHWANVSAIIESDPVHRELLDQLEQVYLEAFDLLGGEEPDDLEHALRTLEVPQREISIEELADALAYQLELVGLPVGEDTHVDRVTVIADAFLEEVGHVGDRMNELEQERDAALARVAEIDEQLAALGEEVIDLTDAATERAVLDDATRAELEAELAEVEEDERDHRDLVEARESLLETAEAAAASARRRLEELAAELAPSLADVLGVPGVGHAPDSDAAFDDTDDVDAGPEAVEFLLLGRVASLRNVSYAGSVPLLLDDALEGLDPPDVRHLLDRLERMADAVQVIYLSDDPVVVGWANDIGFERAAVVAAPPAFA